MTTEEARIEMSADRVTVKTINGKPILVPLYDRDVTIGLPMYGIKNGDGWRIGSVDECFEIFDIINARAIKKERLREELGR